MPTAKVLELLDQAQAVGFAGRVGFYHYSEPLLDQRSVLFGVEAKKRGMKPYLHTNGDVLRQDASLCDEVKRVYGLIVIGLYDYRTNAELEDAKSYWSARLPGANLEFSPIPVEGGSGVHSVAIPRALVPRDSRMTAPDLTFPNAPCHRPLIRMLIQHDGTVCNCCEDTYGAFDLGNVYQNSIEQLWFSDRHISLVGDLVEGKRRQFPLCRTCPLSPTGPAPGGTRIEMIPRRGMELAAETLEQ